MSCLIKYYTMDKTKKKGYYVKQKFLSCSRNCLSLRNMKFVTVVTTFCCLFLARIGRIGYALHSAAYRGGGGDLEGSTRL